MILALALVAFSGTGNGPVPFVVPPGSGTLHVTVDATYTFRVRVSTDYDGPVGTGFWTEQTVWNAGMRPHGLPPSSRVQSVISCGGLLAHYAPGTSVEFQRVEHLAPLSYVVPSPGIAILVNLGARSTTTIGVSCPLPYTGSVIADVTADYQGTCSMEWQ